VSKEELNHCADGDIGLINCLTYGKGDGLPTLECSGGFQPAGARTSDGRLWFPTTKGLVAVNPTEVKRNQLPPPVIIEEVLVDGRPITASHPEQPPFRISPGRQQFEFQYTGLSFTVPEKVRFKYRLEGLETKWMDAGTKRSINYSYIPPGNYTFRVIACNNDGVWNEAGSALAFTVLPHFWQTWWFRTLAGLNAAALVAGSVLFATRRRMRHKVERIERQRAVERERTRIAKDIHDDLGASLTRITLLSQSARGELDHAPEAAADVDQIYRTARELTRAMDEIVWAVNPQHDTLDSLATYLGRFAQDFLNAVHIRCRLDLPMQLPAWPLTAEVRHNLFLAFKEALNNAVRHADASEVRVSLTIEPGGFALRVEDQGRGFATAQPAVPSRDPGRLAAGNGLANMHQRLTEIGGRCDIQSAPGEGTKVTFFVLVKATAS
jgi:signal transduction histidine kinase